MGSEVRLYSHKASQRRHPETIVLVHNMLSSHRMTHRHRRLLNEWGFDTVSFDLVYGANNLKAQLHPLALRLHKGVFQIWTDQIAQVLNQVEGPKIVFSFSGPSLAALIASTSRRDVTKVICDGGPFNETVANTKNLIQFVLGIPLEKVLKPLAVLGTAIWGARYEAVLQDHLKQWDPQVPILSIRGLKDTIVPEATIDSVFSPHPHLKLETLCLPEGRHLDGLKNFTALYKKKLAEFLRVDTDQLKRH